MNRLEKYLERLPRELDDPCVDFLPVNIGPAPALSSPRTRGGAGGRGDGRGGRGSLQKYILLKEKYVSKNICYRAGDGGAARHGGHGLGAPLAGDSC